MDIVSRIKSFMQDRNISSTQFADACSIPRPTLSQILGGRNKKISDEVINKIHGAYPELNVMWLMFGEGPMLVGGNSASTPTSAAPVATATPVEGVQQAGSITFDAPKAYNTPSGGSLFDGEPLDFGDENASEQPQSSAESPMPTVQIPADGSKSIVNIMVFYSDNSFQSFVPR